MGHRIDQLFQEWGCLGGAVLLSETDTTIGARSPQEVIAESTAHCRASGRLTWIVLDWLVDHIQEIDANRLLHQTKSHGDLSVLGVLCDAAYQRRKHPKFEKLMETCVSHPEQVPFFHRVAQSPLASRLAREHALDIFLRWNYLCNELRYLSDDKTEVFRTKLQST